LRDDNARLLAPGRLEVLDAPVMLISGAASPPVMGRIAEAIAARLPDVGVAEVPGAGHMLPVTHPDQVAGLVRVNVSR
jgi:lipase